MSAERVYFGCGIPFASDIRIPGIPLTDHSPEAEVRIGRLADVGLSAENWFQASPGRLQLLIPHIGQYLVTDGRRIVVDIKQNASDVDIRLFLLGSAFGALLHQRGVLPLHASSVRVGDGYVAFVGDSGAGKSTMAAALHQAGYPVAGDDICPVTIESGSDGITSSHRVRVVSERQRSVSERQLAFGCGHATLGQVKADLGFTRLKLWSDALHKLSIESTGLERSDFDRDKYDLPTATQAASCPLPLRGIYVLEYTDHDEEMSITRLRGQACLPLLVQHTYRSCFVKGLGATGQHFQNCATVARSVPIYSLRRRSGSQYLEQIVEVLRQHWFAVSTRCA